MPMKEQAAKFIGFFPETLTFLTEVRVQNSKSWFEERRGEYEQYLLGPMRALVGEMGGYMLTVDPLLEVRPVVGKTISRIFRDTRFSKDKSLFRSHMWFTFKRPMQEWQDAPGYFFEINPDGYCFGMGFYLASRETMAVFRKWIDDKPDKFLAAIAPLQGGPFSLEGEQYKRILDPAKPPELLSWYQRKNFYLIGYRESGVNLFSKSLVDELIAGFELTVPLYCYLWEVIGAK